MLVLKKRDLTGHDVFEWMKGRYDSVHWKEDSVYVTEETFAEAGLEKWFIQVLGFFHYFGPTEVTEAEWTAVKALVNENGSEPARRLTGELDEWVKECFKSHACFTICGI